MLDGEFEEGCCTWGMGRREVGGGGVPGLCIERTGW